MTIEWTTVIASALTATIVSGFTLVANRYLSRMLDRIEREMARKEDKNGSNGKNIFR